MPTYIEISDAEIAPNQPLTTSLITRLRDNALAYLGAPAGTKLVSRSPSAPLGWTTDSGLDDRALRVTSGAPSSGGDIAFSNVFGSAYTPSGGNNPSNISVTVPRDGWGTTGGNSAGRLVTGDGGSGFTDNIEQASADRALSGTADAQSWNATNSKDLRVLYLDVQIITKA